MIHRSNVVQIDYTNHAGVRSLRKIIPGSIEFSNNEWHSDTQWLLNAYDVDKDDVRTFALASIHCWDPTCGLEKATRIDASLAKQLHASIERNSRMAGRLSRLRHEALKEGWGKRGGAVRSPAIEEALRIILNDEEPAWPLA